MKFKLRHNQTHSEPDGNCMVIVSGKCIVTGKDYHIAINIHQLQAWKEGIHIQVAMPYVSAGNREFLISGTSPEGWDKLFKETFDG